MRLSILNKIKGTICYLGFLGSVMAGLVLLPSCTSQDDKFLPEEEEPGCNLTISIPDISFASGHYSTRAPQVAIDMNNNEGKLSSLYFVIFKKESNTNDYYQYFSEDIKNTTNVGGDIHSDFEHTHYSFRLVEGSYKFYLLANIAEYSEQPFDNASDNNPLTDPEEIEKIRLKFDASGISADKIPMICLAKDIKILKGTDEEGKLILENLPEETLTITKDNIDDNIKYTLYAPMSILCSKVRYTILYDTGDFSNKNLQNVNFTYGEIPGENGEESVPQYGDMITNPNAVNIKYVSEITPLQPYTGNVETPNFLNNGLTSYISQVIYPNSADDTTKGYFNIEGNNNAEGQIVIPAYLNPLDEVNKWYDPEEWDWVTEKQRAWQGLVYLPENTVYTSGTDTNARYTTLHLTATGEGVAEDGYDMPVKGMTRGYFYDLVAKMKTSNIMDITVYLRVKPWDYNSQIEEW